MTSGARQEEDVPKKICVTGAAGMTGSVTVRELLEHGYEVVATDLPPEPAGLRGADNHKDLRYTRRT